MEVRTTEATIQIQRIMNERNERKIIKTTLFHRSSQILLVFFSIIYLFIVLIPFSVPTL